jgi:hypothetical protein
MSYETHPHLPDIKDPDTVLWRYLDNYKWRNASIVGVPAGSSPCGYRALVTARRAV